MLIKSSYSLNESTFFELIRVAIGTQATLSRLPSEVEWEELFDMAVKQSLVGVCFTGLHDLGADSDEGYARIGMSEDLFFDWMGVAVQINMRNEVMDGYTKEVLSFFRKKDIPCQVLKGQGVAKLYGDLRGYRQSGDIDVWIAGDKDKAFTVSNEVLGSVEGLTNYHIHFPVLDDAEIELHFKPSFLSSPIRNKRFLDFCKKFEPQEGCGDEPSLAFNRIYILLHCYRHLCGHGVGMRQVLDYYYVLSHGFTEEEKEETMKWISAHGMKRFAMAMMWLMKDVFGLGEQYMLCEANEEYGRFLLEEVMKSGNFGHGNEKDRISGTAVKRYLYNIKRDIHTVKICPHEALWDPVFNVYQFLMKNLFGINNYKNDKKQKEDYQSVYCVSVSWFL